MILSQNIDRKNKTHLNGQKQNIELTVGSSEGFDSEKMTYFDFLVKREHVFLRNIYEKEEREAIKNIENYYFHFQKFIQISLLLNGFHSRGSDTEDIFHDCVSLFFQEENFNLFEELYNEIDKTQIKNIYWSEKTKQKLYKIISYIYMTTMNFPSNKFDIKTVVTKNVYNNMINLMYWSYVIHHSHVTSEINRCAHNFCTQKVRKNLKFVFVFPHKMFIFDSFLCA